MSDPTMTIAIIGGVCFLSLMLCIAGMSHAQKALRRDLPNYMQPQVIHWRESLPRGATGKLDRAGLAVELANGGKP